jgi:uncharacterized protein (DUF1800 family)
MWSAQALCILCAIFPPPTRYSSMLRPLSKAEWTPARAAHLLNRAGFGGSPQEIDALAALGPEAAVASLVDYDRIDETVTPPDFALEGPPEPFDRRAMRNAEEEERKKMQRQRRVSNRVDLNHLRGWWFERMRSTRRPLQEKMTLFWHGHFATSVEKVKSTYAMYLQNETLRRHAAGSWEEIVSAVSHDPAMLIYLDGARSKKQAPNENYARELMELFTLGEGHYTEGDIHEAARAFTGWTIDRKNLRFRESPFMHDRGTKTFMGKTGDFDGADIIRILLDHPEAAPFICRKLWAFFAYPDPEEEIVNGLVEVFLKSGMQFRPVLSTVFRSRAFYSNRAGRTQIKSPVQWLVSTLKYLEAPLPDPGLCAYVTARLGQTLFEPPNVKGWEGGTAWITPATLLERYNLAAILVEGGESTRDAVGDGGRDMRRMMMMEDPMAEEDNAKSRRERRRQMQARRKAIAEPVVDPDVVLPGALRTDGETVRRHLQWRLFQSELRPKDREAFESFFATLPKPRTWKDADVRAVVHAMLSTPQFQLT